MAEYTLYLRIPQKGFKTFILHTPDDTIKDIYRYVRDTEDVPIKMMSIPKLQKYSKKDRILDHFDNQTSFDVHYKLLSGPKKLNGEFLNVYVILPNINHKCYLKQNPDDTIDDVIKNVLDMVDIKYPINLTSNDVELIYKNKILNS